MCVGSKYPFVSQKLLLFPFAFLIFSLNIMYVIITLGVDSSSLQLRVNPEEILRVYFLISKLISSASERDGSFLGPFYSSMACFSFLIMLLNRFLTLFSVRLLRSSFETSDHFFPFSIINFKRLKSSLSLHGPLKQ